MKRATLILFSFKVYLVYFLLISNFHYKSFEKLKYRLLCIDFNYKPLSKAQFGSLLLVCFHLNLTCGVIAT
jgi:hypothetical protein